MKKILLLTALILACLLAGCEKKEETPQSPNFFRHAVELQEDGYAPKGLTFGMSLNSFLKKKGLDYGAVEPDGIDRLRVASEDGSFPDIDAPMTEVYLFKTETLCSVVYHFWAEDAQVQPLLQTLSRMAREFLPAPTDGSSLEDLQSTGACSWTGKDGTQMFLSCTEVKDGRTLVTFSMEQAE